jgi:hypothetical protein
VHKTRQGDVAFGVVILVGLHRLGRWFHGVTISG